MISAFVKDGVLSYDQKNKLKKIKKDAQAVI